MNNIILLGKWILSEGLNMMRSKIPFFLIWSIFCDDKALIISNRQKNRVFALSFAIVDGWFVLKFNFVFVVIMADSLFDI